MAGWVRIANTAKGSTDANGFTTAAIDTTRANLLIVYASFDSGGTTITDSKSNSWLNLGVTTLGATSARISYVKNPIVGAGHTFTCSGTGSAAALCVAAFSGADTLSPFDVENGTAVLAGSQSTIQLGAITPGQNGSLIVFGVGWNTSNTGTVDSEFTISDQIDFAASAHYGAGLAWLAQETAAATQPIWSYGGITVSNPVGRIASFKPAPYAGTIAEVGTGAMTGQQWI